MGPLPRSRPISLWPGEGVSQSPSSKTFQLDKRGWELTAYWPVLLTPLFFRRQLGNFLPQLVREPQSSHVGISGTCQPISAGPQFSCSANGHLCPSLTWNCPLGLSPLHPSPFPLGSSQLLQGYQGL